MMLPDAFALTRAEHDHLRDALLGIEAGLASGDLAGAAAAWLTFFAERMEPHMQAEEREVYALFARRLDAGIAREMRADHDTARALTALLAQACARGPEAAEEVQAMLQDLLLLLRAHLRKEEQVVQPLLERLRPE